MANEIYLSAITGLNPTLQLYSGSTPQGSLFSMTEIGTTGDYIASVPNGVPYGYYLIMALLSGVKIASGELYWDGLQEISPIMYEELNRIAGLNASEPMSATPTSRTAGDINLDVTGYGTAATTVQRV